MADHSIPEIEEWRTIEGFPDYAVSNLGRVRRETNASGTKAGRILIPFIHHGGYSVISVFINRRRLQKSVHTLVCAAFHGLRPSPEHQAAHWDGDKQNNRAENLRWVTPAENSIDSIRQGRTMRGEKNHTARLTSDEVRSIRNRLANGEMQKQVAADFGVTPTTIAHIGHGRAWGWLK